MYVTPARTLECVRVFRNASSRTQCVRERALEECVFENARSRKALRLRGTRLRYVIIWYTVIFHTVSVCDAPGKRRSGGSVPRSNMAVCCDLCVRVTPLCSRTRLYICVREPVFQTASSRTRLLVSVCSGCDVFVCSLHAYNVVGFGNTCSRTRVSYLAQGGVFQGVVEIHIHTYMSHRVRRTHVELDVGV